MLNKIFIFTLLSLTANAAFANDFTVSGKAELSTERGARNLGIAFSDTGGHVTVSGKVQHQSGWLVEAATGNANSQWQRVDEFAFGWAGKLGNNWLLRTDAFRLRLDGVERPNETVDSLRLALISTNKDWKVRPRIFAQHFLGSLPGKGTALRPGMNVPFGESGIAVYAEATVHDGLFNQEGFTHSSNRFGFTYNTKQVSIEFARVEAKDTPVLEDRTAVQFSYKF